MRHEFRAQIEREFRDCVSNTIRRLAAEDTLRPFHAALLSESALFWSRFERSFSTSFGQRVVERISRVAALSGGAKAALNQKETTVTLSASQLAAIDTHIALCRKGGRKTWSADIAALSAISGGASTEVRVISDLWWTTGGIEHFMSIKTVKPNIDQSAEAKRDLLKIALARPEAKVYFGLYYNPYGESRADYAWTPPNAVFDCRVDDAVLIGKDYWDCLGGAGCYEEVLAIAIRVGETTRTQIADYGDARYL
jgi:hypothetical protein